jgi:hypothetical protein
MKMFRKLIVGLAFATCMGAVYADDSTYIDTKNLSAAQIAELKALAAQKAADAVKAEAAAKADQLLPKDPSTLATMAATWGQQAAVAAEGFAKALAIAAKELGITINEFLATPAGKLTAALIIWKVAGAAIVHMLYGVLFIAVGLIASRVIYVRLFTAGYETVTYERFFGLWKGTKLVRRPKGFGDLKTDGEWFAFWVMMIFIVGTILIGGAFF